MPLLPSLNNLLLPSHADLMRIVGGDGIETLITQETLARMSLSAVKQPGIAVAYENILGFDGTLLS